MLRKGAPLASQPAATTAETDGSGQWNLDQQTHTGSSDFVGSSTAPSASSSAEPTIIQLDDHAAMPAGGLDDGMAMMTGDTGMRARAAGGAPPSSSERPQLSPPQSRRAGRGKQHDEDDFDPVEEFLAVLPPPLARGLVAVGKKLNPSGMQLVAVKKDLHEDPNKANDTVYTSGNKHRQLVQALTAGLKPYGLALAIATIVWLLTTLITPAFFGYPYLYKGFSIPDLFSASWALLLWGGVLSSAVWYFRGRDVRTQGRPFLLKAANALILATLEEFGFRFLFVCVAMVVAALFNGLIEQVGLYLGALMMCAGIVVIIIAALYLMGVLKQNEHVRRIMKRYNPVHVVVGSGILIAAGLFVLVMGLVWSALFSIVWDWIIFPVANFLTLYQYDQFFMGAFGMNTSNYQGAFTGSRMRRKMWQANAVDNRMFMVGVLLANVFYRDGKKYQGVLGWINSWYVGLALANVMINHGLFTALAVHLLYDAQFFVAGYLINKYFAKRRASLDDL